MRLRKLNFPQAKLRQKGQITLPADIRKKMQVSKGDIFDLEVLENKKIVMTIQKITFDAPVDVSKYIGIAKGSFGSVQEIDDYIRNERSSWG